LNVILRPKETSEWGLAFRVRVRARVRARARARARANVRVGIIWIE
jgi:hypothetical protein